MTVDITRVKSIHFVGIKGVAMTALAILAKERGIEISGSDVEEEFPTDATLHHFNILYQKGFDPKHIPTETDLIVYTGAHQGVKNAEVQEGLRRRIPVLAHGRALGLFMESKLGVTISGSHGKTTTSAIIAHVLTKLGEDPSFAVGCGEIISLKTSGHWGSGKYFVAEGDEYATDPTFDKTPRFMWHRPTILLITNIDFDHPDVYSDLEAVKTAFVKFSNSLAQNAIVVINLDDQTSRSIIPQIQTQVVTYGEDPQSDFRLCDRRVAHQSQQFTVFCRREKLATYKLGIPGKHNALNALGVIATLVSLKFKPSELVEPLSTFIGTKRRFELVAEKNGKLLYDDYAHHPKEVFATINAAKEWYSGKRLVVVFQPHTYSRTQALLEQFASCFFHADQIVLTDIYASARETPVPGVSGMTLFEAVKRNTPAVFFAPKRADVLEYLRVNTRENDLILLMGAGNIFTWLPDIRKVL